MRTSMIPWDLVYIFLCFMLLLIVPSFVPKHSLTQTIRTIPKGDYLYSARISKPRQFCHLPSELCDVNWLPSRLCASDPMESQHMPTGGAPPLCDVLVI